MPRILPLTEAEQSADTKAAFAAHVTNHSSRITNMKSTMGRSVLVFNIYMQWYDLYEQVKAIVGSRAAYLFAHAISEGSNCPLCTTYFRKVIVDNGEDPKDLLLSDTDQALLDFGSAIANNKGEVPDGLYAQMAQAYSETELVVLVGFAGQMIATNIFNNVFEVQIDGYLANYTSMTNKA